MTIRCLAVPLGDNPISEVPTNLAYVLFTSYRGVNQGAAKGVMVDWR